MSVGALALTGSASAATRLESVSQLVTTPYGRMILVKSRPAGRRLLALAAALVAPVGGRWRPGGGGSGAGCARRGAGRRRPAGPLRVPGQPVALPTFGGGNHRLCLPAGPDGRARRAGWHPDWVWLTAALLAVALYLAALLILRRRGDAWPTGRLVAWWLGWAVVVWATCGGVAWYAPVSFTLHMVSHMALAMLAPVLLVLGGPITLALRVIPPATGGARGPREWIPWALHSPATRFLTNPVLVLLLYTVGLYGLYYTDLYATLMSSHLGHFAMQAHFLAGGTCSTGWSSVWTPGRAGSGTPRGWSCSWHRWSSTRSSRSR